MTKPSKHVLKAAFGMETPEDDESTAEPFSDATDFDPKGYAFADGGEVGHKPKLGSGKRFAALKGALSRREGVENPGALAAAIGRKKFGAKKMASLAAHGKEHHAYGGEAGKPSFAQHMARRYGSGR